MHHGATERCTEIRGFSVMKRVVVLMRIVGGELARHVGCSGGFRLRSQMDSGGSISRGEGAASPFMRYQ